MPNFEQWHVTRGAEETHHNHQAPDRPVLSQVQERIGQPVRGQKACVGDSFDGFLLYLAATAHEEDG